MLLVYLINRWARVFEPGHTQIIAASEPFHVAVVEAYLRAGCSKDEAVAARMCYQHCPPSFQYQVQLRGKLSPRTFVAFMLGELHPEMYSDAYAQLERLKQLLDRDSEPAPTLPEAALTVSYALVVRGVRLFGSQAKGRAEAEALKLRWVVAGDAAHLAPQERDVVVGLALTIASAQDGQPIQVDASAKLSDAQTRHLQALAPIQDYLVASGPLASAILAQGTLGAASDKLSEQFLVGADMSQNPHPLGIWGTPLVRVSAAVKACDLSAPNLFLIARYD
jgi:hypothetical protein